MAKLSSRQILVGRLPARMQGLDEMFDGLYELGRRPDEAGLGMALVERDGVLISTPDDKVEVVELFKCVVGCSSCATICKPGAITFPPRTILDAFRPGR